MEPRDGGGTAILVSEMVSSSTIGPTIGSMTDV